MHEVTGASANSDMYVVSPQDSKSHHERELKAAEQEVERSRKAAEDIVTEAGTQQQTMQTLQLEVEELGKAIAAQQQQVSVRVWELGGVGELLLNSNRSV